MCAADDRCHVMLAERVESYIAQHHHFVVTLDFFEGAAQVRARVAGISGKPIGVGVDASFRRVMQALPQRVIAGPAQQRPHCRFGGAARHLALLFPGHRISPGTSATRIMQDSIVKGASSRTPLGRAAESSCISSCAVPAPVWCTYLCPRRRYPLPSRFPENLCDRREKAAWHPTWCRSEAR